MDDSCVVRLAAVLRKPFCTHGPALAFCCKERCRRSSKRLLRHTGREAVSVHALPLLRSVGGPAAPPRSQTLRCRARRSRSASFASKKGPLLIDCLALLWQGVLQEFRRRQRQRQILISNCCCIECQTFFANPLCAKQFLDGKRRLEVDHVRKFAYQPNVVGKLVGEAVGGRARPPFRI